jgi:hypothetical protein
MGLEDFWRIRGFGGFGGFAYSFYICSICTIPFYFHNCRLLDLALSYVRTCKVFGGLEDFWRICE